ncbi:MAG: ATP-binding cassette domain-containing protein [Coriobacteriales bacterium]|jgi:peptide/nickel transport system ATP-binding protein|nr:ATP-binding cassette domain-containing protein [Coriobacteriales bacterium]
MTGCLEARDLVFAYPGSNVPVIDGLSLAVGAEERVALHAPSGSGKTTLGRLLAGYLAPLAGEVLLDGAVLPRRGMCPIQLIGQHPELVCDPRMRMRDVLKEAGTPDEEVFDGLGIRREWLARYAHELSGGELQRFCIARALAARARFLIADEITTMLDAVSQAQLWRFILDKAAADGIGIVFVSHSPALVSRVATRVVALRASASASALFLSPRA